MGPDGRTVVRVRVHLPGPPSPGDHVEMEDDPVRWYALVSSRALPGSQHTSPSGAPTCCYELVLRESSPGERLAWEVMSS
jgi:hypothetical protein